MAEDPLRIEVDPASPVGSIVGVTLAGVRVAVVRHAEGWVMLPDRCPHAGCSFVDDDGEVAEGTTLVLRLSRERVRPARRSGAPRAGRDRGRGHGPGARRRRSQAEIALMQSSKTSNVRSTSSSVCCADIENSSNQAEPIGITPRFSIPNQ